SRACPYSLGMLRELPVRTAVCRSRRPMAAGHPVMRILHRESCRHLEQSRVGIGLQHVGQLHGGFAETWIGSLDHDGDLEVRRHPDLAYNLNRIRVADSAGRNGLSGA